MTDQDRMEETAEGELLNDLLDAAAAPAAPPATAAETVQPEAPAPSAAPPEAPAPAPESAVPIADTDATATEDAPDPVATDESAAAEAPVSEAGASFTPVAESEGRPRRLKDLEVGMELQGRVTSIALYGIFVDIGVGRDGLVHISEMSDTRIDSPSDIVQINDPVSVRIKSIDPDARRISLTMRTPRTESDEAKGRGRKRSDINRDLLSSLKAGDTIEGIITGMAPFGAFADIGVGKDGLVHISELSESRVEKPEDAVKVGERYNFKILEVDPEGTRISLSLRRAQRTQKMQQLEPGMILDGTVSGLAPFGAFVDIGVGRDGLVHISALSENRVNKVDDVVKEGDKVKVRVLEVDPQSKRISLTMRLEDPAPVESEGEGEAPSSSVVPRTGPGAAPRFAAAMAAREEGRRDDRRREDRRGGRGRPTTAQQTSESYSTEDEPEEEFEGNATLEDLLTKFGGPSSRRDRERRRDEPEEEDSENRYARRQRDAIRRTLQQVGPDE